MDALVTAYLSGLELGKPQQFENLEIIPLFTSVNHSPEYYTLSEALEKELLTVTEISEGGSVPELKVGNKADIPVLLIDGEELIGAKQNRVLNASILLKKKSDTLIPVSCTEHGRWSYVSHRFSDSGTITSPRIRGRMSSSVTSSLRASRTYRSDQHAVWSDIDQMASDARVDSPTAAMRDIFESKANDLKPYLDAFTHQPHQKGLLSIINGEVIGLDVVSLESAYERIHPKFVKSYAIDALLQKKGQGNGPVLEKARNFIEEITACQEKVYDSVGHGNDYRFEGNSLVGSALIYDRKVIHLAFFRLPQRSAA